MKYKMNEDGTQMLDAEGNPIEDTDTKDESELTEVNKQLVEELKELRTKNSFMKELLEANKDTPSKDTTTPPQPPSEEERVAAIVKKTLEDQNSSKAQANKTAAFEKYVTDNKDFHPENDSLGLKRDALLRKYNQFNTDGLIEVEDYYSVIRDAHSLLGRHDTAPDTSKEFKNPYSSIPTPKGTPPARDDVELSPKEKKFIENSNWTKERFLKLKAKDSAYVEDLMAYVRV
jgi:hypothetical protein